MAFETEAGTFTLNTGTGNQTVTLANGSLTPKAVIVWTTAQTADGITTDAKIFLGFATSTTARATMGTTSQDAQVASVADRTNDNDELLQCRPVNAGAVSEEFDFVSFAAGEFVINVTVAGAALKIHYMVLGGTDLTNANVLEFSCGSGTGTLDVTGVGFQPDAYLIFGQFDSTPDRTQAGVFASLGFGSGNGQAAVGWVAADAAATMNTERVQLSDAVIAMSNSAGGYAYRFAHDSFLSDGVRLNRVANAFSNRLFWMLCLKGGQYEVGADTQKTSTSGTKATTTDFQPKGLFLASVNKIGATTISTDGCRLSLGAASSATARAASWIGDVDNVADSECDRATESDQCLLLIDTGSPAAYAAAADLNSFNATDFTLDWDDGAGGNPDATAREFIWMAFGDSAAVDAISVDDFTALRVFQRTTGTTAKTLNFTGTYTNTVPTTIEVEIREHGTANVIQAWTTITGATIAGGTWEGDVSVPEGGWYNIIARSKDGGGTVLATSTQTSQKWGVGILIACLGQSNMSNMFDVSSTPPASTDQTSRYFGGWGAVIGNGAIRLANLLYATLGIPIGLLDYAVSGSGLTTGGDNWSSGTAGQPYPLFQIGLTAVGSDIEYVLWHQGEGDALAGATAAAYKTALDALYANIQTDTGRDNTELFFGCAAIGNIGAAGVTDTEAQTIRIAQYEWVAATTGAFFAGSSIDMVRTDDYHWTAPYYERMGRRYAQAVLHHLGEVAFGAEGPVIASASRTSGSPNIQITVTHDGGTAIEELDGSTDGGSLTGWEVSDDDFSTTLTISSTSFSAGKVVLTLSVAPADLDTIKVRYLWGSNPSITNTVHDDTTPGSDTVGLVLQPTQSPVTAELVEGSSVSPNLLQSNLLRSHLLTGLAR